MCSIMYISDKTHIMPQRLPNMCLTQPLPALSDSQVVGVVYSTFTTNRAGRKEKNSFGKENRVFSS